MSECRLKYKRVAGREWSEGRETRAFVQSAIEDMLFRERKALVALLLLGLSRDGMGRYRERCSDVSNSVGVRSFDHVSVFVLRFSFPSHFTHLCDDVDGSREYI